MPIMDGQELIRHLKESGKDPLMICPPLLKS